MYILFIIKIYNKKKPTFVLVSLLLRFVSRLRNNEIFDKNRERVNTGKPRFSS